jgi:hypothetical protein
MIKDISRVQYDDIHKLQIHKEDIQKNLQLASAETRLESFLKDVKEDPSNGLVGAGVVDFFIDFYDSFELTQQAADINFSEVLKAFDAQSIISESGFQNNMKAIIRGLVVLLQKGIS